MSTLEYEVLRSLAGIDPPLEQRGWVNKVLSDLQSRGDVDASFKITVAGMQRLNSDGDVRDESSGGNHG